MRKHYQSGFAIGTILLAVILIAIIAAAIAVSSRSSTSNSARAKGKVNASILLQQAAQLRQGYEKIVLESGYDPMAVLFNASAETTIAGQTAIGLFNPSTGIPMPVVPADAVVKGSVGNSNLAGMQSKTKTWVMTKNVNIPVPQGGGDQRSIAVFIVGVDPVVCQAINNIVLGVPFSTTLGNYDGVSNIPTNMLKGAYQMHNVLVGTAGAPAMVMGAADPININFGSTWLYGNDGSLDGTVMNMNKTEFCTFDRETLSYTFWANIWKR